MAEADTIRATSINSAVFFGEAANIGAADIGIADLSDSFTVPTIDYYRKDALTAVNGMIIYNSSTNKFQGYENGSWSNLI